MQVKFGAIVFPNVFPFPDLTNKYHFDKNTFVFKGSLKNFLDPTDNSHWKQWLGTLVWEPVIERESLIFMNWKEGGQTEVNDVGNQVLLSHLTNLYSALLLTGPWRQGGQ